jgi:hypothetical protein
MKFILGGGTENCSVKMISVQHSTWFKLRYSSNLPMFKQVIIFNVTWPVKYRCHLELYLLEKVFVVVKRSKKEMFRVL